MKILKSITEMHKWKQQIWSWLKKTADFCPKLPDFTLFFLRLADVHLHLMVHYPKIGSNGFSPHLAVTTF